MKGIGIGGIAIMLAGGSIALYCFMVWFVALDTVHGTIVTDLAQFNVFHPYIAAFIAGLDLVVFGAFVAAHEEP